MKLESLLDSTKFNIAVGRMIERMHQAKENGLDWNSIDEASMDFDIIDSYTDDNVTVSIELVPAWATLENIDAESDVDLYNEYNETDFSYFGDIQATGVNPYEDMDVKIRTLDHDTMMSETLQVYYLTLEDHQKVNSLYD